MAKIAGTAHLKIDGANYSTHIEEGYEITIQNTKAEVIMASDGSVNYAESPVPDKISGSLLTRPELDPMVLVNARNATVQVQLANGKTAVLRNAIFTGDPTVSTKDGKFKIEFTGVGKWI